MGPQPGSGSAVAPAGSEQGGWRSHSHRPWLENPDTNGKRKTNREGNEQIIPIIGLKNASKKNDIQ